MQASLPNCSSKREPLGKGYVRGHKIPDGLGAVTPFGAPVHAKVSLRMSMLSNTAYSPPAKHCNLLHCLTPEPSSACSRGHHW